MFEAQLDMNVAVSENQVTPINGNFNMFNMYIYIERVDIMIKQQIEFQCQVTSLAIAISMGKLKL